jgi:hypothetical protein
MGTPHKVLRDPGTTACAHRSGTSFGRSASSRPARKVADSWSRETLSDATV